MICCKGAVLCIVRCLAASLASILQIQEHLSLVLPNVPWRQGGVHPGWEPSPWLEGTVRSFWYLRVSWIFGSYSGGRISTTWFSVYFACSVSMSIFLRPASHLSLGEPPLLCSQSLWVTQGKGASPTQVGLIRKCHSPSYSDHLRNRLGQGVSCRTFVRSIEKDVFSFCWGYAASRLETWSFWPSSSCPWGQSLLRMKPQSWKRRKQADHTVLRADARLNLKTDLT